jgi:hypothetical protein
MRLGWPAALRPNGPLSSIALADTSARLKGTRRSWNSPGTATVEIELATPEGSTVVTLVHRSLDGIVKLFENDCGAVDVSLFGGQI